MVKRMLIAGAIIGLIPMALQAICDKGNQVFVYKGTVYTSWQDALNAGYKVPMIQSKSVAIVQTPSSLDGGYSCTASNGITICTCAVGSPAVK